jgi:dTDP-4-dehydrorhamnose reductase
MNKVLIIGADGQLGQEIMVRSKSFPYLNFVFSTINDLDVTNQQQINDCITTGQFQFVVNCAAYTDVNKAESEMELAHQVNAKAPEFIGLSAVKNNTKVIHISTDYVFNGMGFKPYSENDPVEPLSAYGKSKLAGEQLLAETGAESMIIRTSWLYSSFGNNFVKTMLRLAQEKAHINVVADQVGSPTYAGDLADAILTVISNVCIEKQAFIPGIYHYSNEGVCSWYDFTLAIFEEYGSISCAVHPITTEDFPTPAPRPHYSVLNKSKIKTIYSLSIPHWKESLQHCIAQLKSVN